MTDARDPLDAVLARHTAATQGDDAELLAHAQEDVGTLLVEVRRLREENARLQAAFDGRYAPLDLRADFEAEGRTQWSEGDQDGNVTRGGPEDRQP